MNEDVFVNRICPFMSANGTALCRYDCALYVYKEEDVVWRDTTERVTVMNGCALAEIARRLCTISLNGLPG